MKMRRGITEPIQPWEEVVLDGSAGEPAPRDGSMAASLAVNPALAYQGYQALVSRTVAVFGDEIVASRWLSMPCADLGGEVPLQVAERLRYDPAKINVIFEPIFVRIEHGIYY